MHIVDKVVQRVKESKIFPMSISNKDLPIIEESFYVIKTLEAMGYEVDTFVNSDNKTYGITVHEKA